MEEHGAKRRWSYFEVIQNTLAAEARAINDNDADAKERHGDSLDAYSLLWEIKRIKPGDIHNQCECVSTEG